MDAVMVEEERGYFQNLDNGHLEKGARQWSESRWPDRER